MRPRQLLMFGASFAIAAGAMLFAVPAWASYSGDGGVTVTPSSVSAGGSVTIDSSGWKPSSSTTITLHSDPVVLATVTTDSSGTVHTAAAIPSNTPAGAHTIELTGTDVDSAPRTATVSITVTSASGGGGSLPRTGAAVAALSLVGLALFGGGSLMAAARRRAAR
jgi:LPXTG-motif cell wall-anchored protein